MSGAPVRMGVLGCASIAVRRMLPAMVAAPEIELVAVASRDAARAAETARRFGARGVHGYARLLARDDVNAVYLPLPAALHAEWTEAALRAGKHVLAEKPLTTDVDRTRHLCALAAERGLALLENVMFVHHSQHAEVRRLLAAGAVGEVRAVHAAFAIPRLPGHDIRYRPDLGGGALWDVGVYPVRAALHYLGTGLAVTGAVLTTDPATGVDVSGAAVLRTADGTPATLAFGLDHAYRAALEVWGSTGRLVLERAFAPPADHRPVLRLELPSGAEERRLAPDDQVGNAVRAFAAAVGLGAAPDRAIVYQAELLDALRRFAGTVLPVGLS